MNSGEAPPRRPPAARRAPSTNGATDKPDANAPPRRSGAAPGANGHARATGANGRTLPAGANGRGHGPAPNGANGQAPNGANGRGAPGRRVAHPPREAGVLSHKAPRRKLGAPRTPPVGEEKVYRAQEAAAMGPQNQRVFKWAPRCRFCGHAIRGTVEVIAPTEGPERGEFAMACEHIRCPSCRNENQVGPLTSWVVVAGPLPVQA